MSITEGETGSVVSVDAGVSVFSLAGGASGCEVSDGVGVCGTGGVSSGGWSVDGTVGGCVGSVVICVWS